MFELIFLGFFIFIIVLIIYSTVKEKDFSQKVYTSLQNRFPGLDFEIVSEGGFFSNLNIRGIANNKNEYIKYLDLRVKVYHSGKHRHEDLNLSAEFIIPGLQYSDFSTLIKREGFFKRIFGGENVQVGNVSIDDKLFIKASDPYRAKLFLSDNNFFISSSIAQISDLKECKISIEENMINLYIRSDKVSSWYVESLFDLVQSMRSSKPIKHRFGKVNPKKVMSSISTRVSPPLKNQRVPSIQSTSGYSKTLSGDNQTQEITEKLKECQFNAADLQIHDYSATISLFSGFFKDISFNWTASEITLHSQREAKLSEPFRIFMTSSKKDGEVFDWNDPFKGINFEINPEKVSEDFLRRQEIGRHFNELLGVPRQVTLEYTQKICQVTIKASALPENIQPMIDLIQALSWFIELSFITYF